MNAFWKTEEESKTSSAPSSEVTPAACCSAVFIIQSHLSFGAFCQPSRRCLETTVSAVSSLCTLQELRCSCEAGRQESAILKWQLQVSREDVSGEVALWGGGRGLCICQVWSPAGSAEALAAAARPGAGARLEGGALGRAQERRSPNTSRPCGNKLEEGIGRKPGQGNQRLWGGGLDIPQGPEPSLRWGD